MTFHSIKTYFAKKDKNNLTKHFVHKELRRSNFLIAIKEYVGARETPSSTAKR